MPNSSEHQLRPLDDQNLDEVAFVHRRAEVCADFAEHEAILQPGQLRGLDYTLSIATILLAFVIVLVCQ